MVIWFIAPILFLISSGFEGVMDFLNWYPDSIPWNRKFWDPRISDLNKYLNGDPKLGPKYPGSTGILVAFTDGWHLMKWCRNRFHELGMVCFQVAVIWSVYQNWNSLHEVVPAYLSLAGCLAGKLVGFPIVYNWLKFRYRKN